MADEAVRVWYGFLEAGPRSSPVVRDHALDTGSPDKIYLFNLQRGAFLEYRRDIVETRLRELEADEAALAEELREAYQEARKSFTPRRRTRLTSAPRSRTRVARRAGADDEGDDDTGDDVPQIPEDWGDGADDDDDDEEENAVTDDLDDEDDGDDED